MQYSPGENGNEFPSDLLELGNVQNCIVVVDEDTRPSASCLDSVHPYPWCETVPSVECVGQATPFTFNIANGDAGHCMAEAPDAINRPPCRYNIRHL